MTQALILLTVLLPLLLSLGYLWEKTRYGLIRALPVAALPGLALALFGSADTLGMPWLLEGAIWGLDDVRRVFLVFTSLLWGLAGLYALFYFSPEDDPRHFALFWLLTLSGNLGLILAQDIASFYTFFALMTLAAYGLVVHDRSADAQRAGRAYLVLALAGEMALLAGLIMAAAPAHLTLLAEIPAAVADSAHRHWIMALLFSGFGVKAGSVLLHMWLPLAHPAAPTPASAVLSGAMIKAGLFGWLYTLPLGEASFPNWANTVIIAGLVAAFGGAALGVCQRVPKAVLAYSSISQMGLMTVMVGVGLAAPESWGTIMAAIVLYAMHHGLAKGALFLSAGTAEHAGGWPRALFWTLVWLPGLSLTGLVLTSGAAAKGAFKDALHHAEIALAIGPWLETLLSAGAVATTLLVARYICCLRPQWGTGARNGKLMLIWTLATACSLLAFWWLPLPGALAPPSASVGLTGDLTVGLAKPLGFLWPPLLGLVLSAAALGLGLQAWNIPAGDLIVPLGKLWRSLLAASLRAARFTGGLQARILEISRAYGSRLMARGARLLDSEQSLRAQSGLTFSLILVGLLAALLAPLLLSR